MVDRPRELSVLLQTKLTLVIAEAAGHDPLKATGLVLTHLPAICERTDRAIPQLWTLRASPRPHTDPWDQLAKLAGRRDVKTKTLYEGNRLVEKELTRNPLES